MTRAGALFNGGARLRALTLTNDCACEDGNGYESYLLFPQGVKAEGVASVPVTGLTRHLALRNTLKQSENQFAETPALVFTPLLSDNDLANILVMTTAWVRSHAGEIPGFKRLGSYFRFCSQSVEQWLGSLDRLFEAAEVSVLLAVPESWVYANADQIPGVLRLGRYVRFRPTIIRGFLGGSEVVQ